MTDNEKITLSLTIAALFLFLGLVYGIHHEGWHMLHRIALVPFGPLLGKQDLTVKRDGLLRGGFMSFCSRLA